MLRENIFVSEYLYIWRGERDESYKRSWLRLQDSGGRSLLSSQEERLGLLGKDGEEEDEEEVAGYGMKGGKRVGIICGRT